MTTTTPEIRVFIAPINQPTRGRWKDVGGPYIDENIREEMTRVREETSAEELTLADAEGLPRSIMPRYGGVPVEKISTFFELADLHGAEIARAYVNMFGAEVDVEEWVPDAEARVLGIYRDVEEYAYECLGMYDTGDLPSRYLDASAMARDLEASGDIYAERLSASRVAIFRGHI
jgi:antirestriction protein